MINQSWSDLQKPRARRSITNNHTKRMCARQLELWILVPGFIDEKNRPTSIGSVKIGAGVTCVETQFQLRYKTLGWLGWPLHAVAPAAVKCCQMSFTLASKSCTASKQELYWFEFKVFKIFVGAWCTYEINPRHRIIHRDVACNQFITGTNRSLQGIFSPFQVKRLHCNPSHCADLNQWETNIFENGIRSMVIWIKFTLQG